MSDVYYDMSADKFIFKVRKDLLYSCEDVWVKQENGSVRLGITDFKQRNGGDILYVQLPNV